jgi:hypothetical protein
MRILDSVASKVYTKQDYIFAFPADAIVGNARRMAIEKWGGSQPSCYIPSR